MEPAMSSISGLSSYQQLQNWQSQENYMQQYLATSQALMSSMTSSLRSLSQGEATLAEKKVLARDESGSSKASMSVLIAELAQANSENSLVSMLNSSSTTSGSTVNLLA
jgi:predicted NodU family carbamoyl transferase